MKIYCIPGLGFDHRIFRNISAALGDSKPLSFIDWIEPKTEEPIVDYARRLSKDIDTTSEKTVLIGHSLGGMVSQQIATHIPIDHIILISSIRSQAELPVQFKTIRKLGLHKYFNKEFVLNTFFLWGKSHDYASEEEQTLFKDMVREQSNTYLKWALHQLTLWEAPALPETTRVTQIHGTTDRTLPYALVQKTDFTLEEAGHFMVFNRAHEISQIIEQVL